MAPFFRPKPPAGPDASQAEWRHRLEESQELRTRLQDAQELTTYLERDRALLLEALDRLRRGMTPEDLGQALQEVAFRPLGLSTLFLAEADWAADQIRSRFVFEAGARRTYPSRSLRSGGGVTGQTLLSGKARYCPSLEALRAAGAIFSEAELSSGLVPQSGYFVPLGSAPQPWGLVGFQSFHADAYGPRQVQIMDGLASVLSLCLS